MAAINCAPRSKQQYYTRTSTGTGPTKSQPQWSRHARRARETGPGSRPLPEGIEVCCRAERCDAGACCWPAPCQLHQLQAHLCGSVSNLSSAEHRSRLSGRRPLSERPSTRISRCRAVPTAGSAGLGRWPARHVPTIARSRDFYFRKSPYLNIKYAPRVHCNTALFRYLPLPRRAHARGRP